MFPRHSLQKPQSKTDEQLMLHISDRVTKTFGGKRVISMKPV
jgi:hypothetical protein